MSNRETILKILDLARWAPSGDNTQPWRFEMIDDRHVAIHGFDTRASCVYDFRGQASHMAHGALLETLRIAASQYGLKALWHLRNESRDGAPVYDVEFQAGTMIAADHLAPFIPQRVVQRRPMKLAPLTHEQRNALANAPGADFTVKFFETFSQRLGIARLLWRSAHIRLVCPEAYEVHRRIIEWGATTSVDKIPEKAVGVDPLTARLMKWAMGSWKRVDFLNRYLFGTIAPRLQLDFIPGLACAAHILLVPSAPMRARLDFVNAGVAMQRLWLTVASQGLYLQPQMTPLIFRAYARNNERFSRVEGLQSRALRVAEYLESLVGIDMDDAAAFFCRVGHSTPPASRSTRLPLDKLMITAVPH